MIAAVDDAEGVIALRNVGHDDAKCHDVGQLLEADVLLLHLAPDRIGRLLAAGHFGVDAGLLQRRLQLVDDAADDIAAELRNLPGANLFVGRDLRAACESVARLGAAIRADAEIGAVETIVPLD